MISLSVLLIPALLFSRFAAAANDCWCQFGGLPIYAIHGNVSGSFVKSYPWSYPDGQGALVHDPLGCDPAQLNPPLGVSYCYTFNGVNPVGGSCDEGGEIPISNQDGSAWPDGSLNISVTCTAGPLDFSSPPKTETVSLIAIVDNSPPEVISVLPPSCDTSDDPSTAGCPAFAYNSTITVSGILDDGSGVGVSSAIIIPIQSTSTPYGISAGTGDPLAGLYQVAGVTITATSGSWQIQITSSTLPVVGAAGVGLMLPDSSGTLHLFLQVSGADALGNIGGNGNTPAGLQFTTTPYMKIEHIIIDRLAPTVQLDLSSGPSKFIPAISGSIHDDYRLGDLALFIQNPLGQYWNPFSGAFSTETIVGSTVSAPIPIPSELTTGPGIRDSSFTYAGFTSRNMIGGQTYLVTAVAHDYVQNASTTTFSISVPAPSRIGHLVQLALNAAGLVTFDPVEPDVTWGGFDVKKICLSGTVVPISALTISNDDGSLILGPMSNNCMTIQSNPTSCAATANIYARYNDAILGSVAVSILRPTSSHAGILLRNVGGAPPAASCASINVAGPCRLDEWKIDFVGPVDMDMNDSSGLPALYVVEDQSQLSSYGGLPMCPLAGTMFPFNKPVPYNSLADLMGYAWQPNLSKYMHNCGERSVQNLEFVSNYAGQVNGCTFITNIRKTSQLNGQQDVITTRSDQ